MYKLSLIPMYSQAIITQHSVPLSSMEMIQRVLTHCFGFTACDFNVLVQSRRCDQSQTQAGQHHTYIQSD